MKVNIIGAISLDKLHRGITDYRYTHEGDYPSYIIVCDQTFYELKSMADIMFPYPIMQDEKRITTFEGIKIARCNSLDFGEVDLV